MPAYSSPTSARANPLRPGTALASAVCLSLLIATWSLGATAPQPHPRSNLFSAGQETNAIEHRLRQPARLSIFFHPDVENCTPHETKVARTLGRVAADFPDIRVFTVLPQARSQTTQLYGEPIPGETLIVTDRVYAAENRLVPRPALEVWTGDERLLLLRSLPASIQEEALYEEVVFTRSFTSPIRTGGASQPSG